MTSAHDSPPTPPPPPLIHSGCLLLFIFCSDGNIIVSLCNTWGNLWWVRFRQWGIYSWTICQSEEGSWREGGRGGQDGGKEGGGAGWREGGREGQRWMKEFLQRSSPKGKRQLVLIHWFIIFEASLATLVEQIKANFHMNCAKCDTNTNFGMVVPKGPITKSASRATWKSKMAAIFQDGRQIWFNMSNL